MAVAPAPRPEGRQYLELRDELAARIAGGELRPGDRLPSERTLHDRLGVARGTIREGLFQLEAEGLIYRRERSGWFVSPPPIVYDPTGWAGFTTYVERQGRRPGTETMSVVTSAADARLAEVFGCSPGAPLHHIRRRRYVDDRAVLVERIVVDPALAPDLPRFSLDGSLTEILKQAYGLSVARNQVTMQPCALTGDTAAALQVRSGAPGLRVRRISSDARGRVVEFDVEHWRHDALEISVDVRVR